MYFTLTAHLNLDLPHVMCSKPKVAGGCPVGQCWFNRPNVLGATLLFFASMHYSEIILSFFASFFFSSHGHQTASFSLPKRFDGLISMCYETCCVNSRAQEFWSSCCFWNCIDFDFSVWWVWSCFWWITLITQYSIYFVSEPLLSFLLREPVWANEPNLLVSFFSSTWKCSSTFRGMSAVSMSLLIGSRGLRN